MKILLIAPPANRMVHTNLPPLVTGDKQENLGHVPPLGLLYLASAARKAGHEVEVLDCQLSNPDRTAVTRAIVKSAPDLVGVTIVTFLLPDALEVIAAAHQAAAELGRAITVVAGGPHATVFPEETARLAGVDYALAGEAEFSFIRLLESMGDARALAAIPGLNAVMDGELIQGPEREVIADLDALAKPDRRLLDNARYHNVFAGAGLMTTMMTSRGCPFNCIYCDRLGKRFRPHSAQYVLNEMADCVDLGIGEIYIHDDTFTVNKKRVLEICRGIQERGWKLRLACRSRVDTMDEELMAAMRRAGFRRVSFGVESGVDRILKRIRKGITLEQARSTFSLARKYGMTTLADFMIGHPDETADEVRATIQFAKDLKPDYVQFSITTPYPATDLYREALDLGVIPGDVWREFARNPSPDFEPPRWTAILSAEELNQLIADAYSAFYLRPSFIIADLLKTRSLGALNRKVRAGLNLAARRITGRA